MCAGHAGDDALARAGVADPAAFRDRWQAWAARPTLGAEGAASLATALLSAARPDAASAAVATLASEGLLRLDAPGAPALARVLGGADFLARRAPRLPEAVAEVAEAAALAPREAAEAHARLAPVAAAASLEDVRRELRRNRYAEYLRITARALAGVPAHETTREISDLADASIDAALHAAERARGVEGWLCAVAMGKLGGRELNYSSDVDLIFAHRDDPAAKTRHPALAQAVTGVRSLLSEIDEEGFAFRVDMDLRPEGRAGAPVTSAPALVEFYESFGRTWERVAWIRARACAGDRALGAQIVEELVPFVYRRYGSFDVLENVRDVKQRIEHEARGAERNLKLGRGGIREAEFVVQALQSLYGGRHPSLRRTHTGEALAALAERGLLDPGRAESLAGDYALLRRVENGIQMAEDRQLYELPEDADGRRRLARRLGYGHADGAAAASALFDDLDAARSRVRKAFDGLLANPRARTTGRPPDADAWSAACRDRRAFAQALAGTAPEPLAERVRRGAERLTERGLPQTTEAWGRLAATPEAAPALALFLASDGELPTHLAEHPEALACFADPEAPLSAAPPPASDLEGALDALRTRRRAAFVRSAAGRLRGLGSETTLRAALSDTADEIVAAGLDLARAHVGRGDDAPEPASLCVLGLGKLGSREMTFHSDLDLVFLYEPRTGFAGLAAQEWAARLAQKLIHFLSTPTSLGRAYEVDTRLRPSGHGGALVASLEAFRLYHERRAQIWEAQALLRARPVAGDPTLGQQARAAVEGALFEFLTYPDLQGEIRRMRQRIERELGRAEGSGLDLKNAAGGIVDAEFLAQYLALREGPRRRELRGGATPTLLEAAGRGGLLRDAADALGALEVLRRAETAVRLATGRSDSVLEPDGPVAPLVAAITGDGEVATLVESVRQARLRLRAIADRELGGLA